MSERESRTEPIYWLEIRPEMRGTPAFRMLVEALLSAAREELEWEAEATQPVEGEAA